MSSSPVIGWRMARELASTSCSMAECAASTARADASYSGRICPVIRRAIQVAKASLSQRSSHHGMVTRSPNHWCASSCAVTLISACSCPTVAVFASSSSSASPKVTAPAFSIAPRFSGTAMRSSLAYG